MGLPPPKIPRLVSEPVQISPGTAHGRERHTHSGDSNISPAPNAAGQPSEIAHEIGLIPLSSGVSKYIGPSSGFSFAKLILARADEEGESPNVNPKSRTSCESPSTTRSRSIFTISPTSLPASLDQAVHLSRIYFEHVHVQYPFLHEPSHYSLISAVYSSYHRNMPKSALFQVTMVLAISATILSKRLRIPFTGEGLCAAAMEYASEVDFQNSTQGVQCLLLISMFTLHSPYLGINPWYLNYQCLAAVLDLGLQRDVPTSLSISPFEREMRTRIFWVVYSIDRSLATTLGRPIGLRDEACDLRLPSTFEDHELDPDADSVFQTQSTIQNGPVACAILLFRLSQINSEIKYILHSISRDTPKYTYPQIPNIQAWQMDLYERLQALHAEIPNFQDESIYLTKICLLKYHEIAMLLFRPTPRIRTPTKDSLFRCHQSANSAIQLWKDLYDSDRLSYSWVTIHSVCLSALTLLYCIWMVPETAAATKIEVLTNTMREASNILSAAGEHWAEARRSRNVLDSLTGATVRWLLDLHLNHNSRKRYESQPVTEAPNTRTTSLPHGQGGGNDEDPFNLDFTGIDTYINGEDLAAFVGAPDPFSSDFSVTVGGMFSEYQPLFDFNPQNDTVGMF